MNMNYRPNINILRSQRKTIALQIQQDLTIILKVPLTIQKAEIDCFLDKHTAWIETHLKKARTQQEKADSQEKLTEKDILRLVEQAKFIIPDRVRYYAQLIGVTYGRITIRSQRSKWGSCSEKGNLNFNCLLMLTPTEVLNSVVVHELCHRKEMNHSSRFYKEVLRVCPDYWKWDQWLKENGPVLFRRIERGKAHKEGSAICD